MGSQRVGGWARRRLRGVLIQLPPSLRGVVARRGWRFSERRFTRRARDRDADWAAAQTRPPLPPARLRALVGKRSDAEHFLATGEDNVRFIRATLERAGTAPTGRVLDFGCGCGRLARWWPRLGTQLELHGCDPNPDLVEWCRSNLSSTSVTRTDGSPPTAYPDDHFDLIYAFSIFTHLSTGAQDAWLEELHRILRPGGAFFLTVNGGLQASTLPHRELASFVRGEPVTLFEEAAGSNLCAAYRPPTYVQEHMLRGFELALALPAGNGRSAIEQDAYVARKPTRLRAVPDFPAGRPVPLAVREWR